MCTSAPVPQQAATSTADKRRRFVDCVVAMLCTPGLMLFLFGIALLLLTGNSPGHHDVVSYWTAGRQLVHHANPYDSTAILRPELAAGVPSNDQVLLMRNPPWALCLVLPLGLLGVRGGSLVWTLLLLGCFVASVRMTGAMLRETFGARASRVHLLGYAFAPALLCVLTGQSSLLALLGLVLFLRLHRTRPYLAGASLYLCALKPHLFLPFGAVLLLWVVATRSYRLLFSFIAFTAAATAVAMAFDPKVWMHYWQMMQTSGIAAEFIACPAVALRLVVDPKAMWLQYLPALLGCTWALRFYAKNRVEWDWIQHGALLTVVSILVSPYAWLTDQAILLPALLSAPMLGSLRAASPWSLRILMLASALIEIQQMGGVTMHSAWVLWTAPFWLVWFLAVSARKFQPWSTPRTARPASPRRLSHTSRSGSPKAAP